MGLACLAGLVGCQQADRPWTEGVWSQRVPDYPFVPHRVLVHPLTRAARGEDGRWALRVHFLFLDAWDDQVKGLGRAQVQLHALGRWEGRPIDPIAWEAIDLNDLTANRRHYDPITRTYVLEVPEPAMPAWLVRALDELEDRASRPGEAYRTFAGPLVVRVVYEAVLADDQTVLASNDFMLAPG
ncbi:MAG: hypothetical protein KatS3mg103_0741 [Phycisphaerales bacterium]|nr:MAG: hypothetical protein KatS3mg103_0741 [Phycisphaerales bacterium]